MLSYMLPAEDKPPSGLGKSHLQLSLEPLSNNNRISKENSISSFASDATTVTASSATPTSIGAKPKLHINGKHQSLKRVSFGSSKGSMVETLIYETPVQEEPEPSPIAENATPFPEDDHQTEDEREKVRVSFVQQLKLQEVILPDDPVVLSDSDYMMAAAVMNDSNHMPAVYNRQESTDSGWDNPFRPGGDLSREADEIVELIKGGKPITPTSAGGSPLPLTTDHIDANNTSTPITESPKKANATKLLSSTPTTNTPKSTKNGNVQNDTKPLDSVVVQRGTMGPPGDASQVEHIVIKKKPKCKCCVIQ